MNCAWLDNYLLIDNDGYTRPCCGETFIESRIAKISNGIMAAFNDEKIIELENNLLHGYSEKTKKYCRRCEYAEQKNNISLRLSTPKLSNKREIKKIQFKLSNKCQLACVHCGPIYSSTWAKLNNLTPHVISGNIITTEFLKEFEGLFPNVDYLKFTGGEPFLDPDHWKLLQHLKPFSKSHCTLEYITNGQTLPKFELWEGFKQVNCTVSIDGFNETYEWFRRGSSWEILNSNIETLKQHTNLAVSFSVTPYTIQDYFEAKEFYSAFPFYPNQVVIPAYCSFVKFPKSLLSQLTNFKDIPFAYNNSDNIGDIVFYQNWADSWDARWNTQSAAKNLFYWYK